MLKGIKRLWEKPLGRAVTSIIILGLLFLALPMRDLWDTLSKISSGTWIGAVLIFIGAHLLGVLKWRMLINTGHNKVAFANAIRFYFAGLFANLFLPSVAGGDVVRAGMAIQDTREKEAVVVGSLVDRLLDVGALVLLVSLGVLFTSAAFLGEYQTFLFWFVLVSIVGVVSGLGLLFVPLPKGTPPVLQRAVTRTRNCITELAKRPGRAAGALTLSLIIQSIFVVLNMFIGESIGLHPTPAAWFIAWPLAKIVAMVPVSIAGLGVREAVLVVFLGRFGVPMAGAVGLGLLWQTIVVAGGVLGGLLFLVTSKSRASLEVYR